MITPVSRYVALGDSFTEGVGDADSRFPNGLRGWADRVAEELAVKNPEFRYANLAVRGRLLGQILDEQLEPALACAPDLVSVYAGGNDMMRPKLDVDALVSRYDTAIAKLVDSGAHVLVFTAFDTGSSAFFSKLRGRLAIYNELVREVADRRGATLVDFWRFSEYRDLRLWDFDRLHMSTAGHENMATRVLDVLGVEHGLTPPELGPAPALTKAQNRREDRQWAREFLVPWVGRRVKGTSSGDGISAKRPELSSALEL